MTRTQRHPGRSARGVAPAATALIAPIALWLAAGCAAPQAALTIPRLPEIDVGEGVVQVLPAGPALDTPWLSNDGRRLAVQTLVYEDPTLPYEVYSLAVAEKDARGAWSPLRVISEGVYRKFLGRMEQPIQPGFDETGETLYLTRLHFESFLSIPCALSLRSWIERMPWEGGPAERVVEREPWGFAPFELIQHPRVSPDGRWLTFYTRVESQDQGVYLLDLATGARHRLSRVHDKHPTWSPDGHRIWFHHSFGGKRHRFDFFAGGLERSVIGYFDLRFDERGGLAGWDRRLMDELRGDVFHYHKHPAEVPGTGLVFFHGETKPDGKKRVLVRRTEPGSQVFELDIEPPEVELKEEKHPAAPLVAVDLMFIAKPDGGEHYNLLFSLTPDAIRRIQAKVESAGG